MSPLSADAQSAAEVQSLTVYGFPRVEQVVGALSAHAAAVVQDDVSLDTAQLGAAPLPVNVTCPQQTWPPEHWPVIPASGMSVAPAQSTAKLPLGQVPAGAQLVGYGGVGSAQQSSPAGHW